MAKQETRKENRQMGPGKGGARDFIALRINSFAPMLLYAWLPAGRRRIRRVEHGAGRTGACVNTPFQVIGI